MADNNGIEKKLEHDDDTNQFFKEFYLLTGGTLEHDEDPRVLGCDEDLAFVGLELQEMQLAFLQAFDDLLRPAHEGCHLGGDHLRCRGWQICLDGQAFVVRYDDATHVFA